MILTVHVKPNASETKFISWLDGGTVVIAIKAPPMEGKANIELIDFLSDKLHIPKTHIILKRGHASKVKHIELPMGTALVGLK